MSMLKLNFSMLGKYLLSLFMSFMIVLSLIFIFSTISTSQIGYTVYTVSENGEVTELYTHMLDDGEDIKAKEYEDKEIELKRVNIYTKFEGAPYTVMLILSQICTLGILVAMIYSKSYYLGDSDANKVNFNRMEYDRFKGLKMGIAPAILSFVFYILLLLGKLGVAGKSMLTLFKLANYGFYSYNEIIFGRGATLDEVGWISIVLALLPVVSVPLISQACYTLGYKHIDLFDRLIFKKKKEGK